VSFRNLIISFGMRRIFVPSEDQLVAEDKVVVDRIGLICAICREIVSEGRETKCGHHFCADCIAKSLLTYVTCPVCKVPLARRLMYTSPLLEGSLRYLSPSVQRVLETLRYKCQYASGGCVAIISGKEYETHMLNCPFRLIECQCRVKYLNRDKRDHLNKHCVLRHIKISGVDEKTIMANRTELITVLTEYDKLRTFFEELSIGEKVVEGAAPAAAGGS